MTKTTFSLRNTSIVEQPSKPAISPLSVAYPILPHGRTYEVPSLHLDQDAVHEQHLDQGEDLEPRMFSREEVLDMLQKGEIWQALMAAPLWKYFAN